jgi:hypothetical protein
MDERGGAGLETSTTVVAAISPERTMQVWWKSS